MILKLRRRYLRETNFRRQGISRQLLPASEQWLRQKGCTQIDSDMQLNNTISYHFHIRMGFKEAAQLIAFIKDLD
ncbi:GNAT family N-acetyltransferase [Adhaeribacter swui]|uniref:GNAT family N-acetyltransferase n=1 Tax=Adhaeribacter swui TaxID=2086471 RepID=A0A7G7GEX4_9BACT|nr:GNAT family N-acetyltransferase [Adhaeribacter swui]